MSSFFAVLFVKFVKLAGSLREDRVESLLQEAAESVLQPVVSRKGVEVSGKLRAKLWEDCQSVLGQVSESLDGLDQCLQVCKTGSTEDCEERCHARHMLQQEEANFNSFKIRSASSASSASGTGSLETQSCSVLLEVPVGKSSKETKELQVACPVVCVADDKVLELFEHSIEKRLCTEVQKLRKDRMQMCSVMIEEKQPRRLRGSALNLLLVSFSFFWWHMQQAFKIRLYRHSELACWIALRWCIAPSPESVVLD